MGIGALLQLLGTVMASPADDWPHFWGFCLLLTHLLWWLGLIMMSALWVHTHNDTIVATCDIMVLACDIENCILAQNFEWEVSPVRGGIIPTDGAGIALAMSRCILLCQFSKSQYIPVNISKPLWISVYYVLIHFSWLVACRLFIGQPFCKFIGQFWLLYDSHIRILKWYSCDHDPTEPVSGDDQNNWPENIIIITLVYS